MNERLRYSFAPLERRGLLGPLAAGPAISLAAGLLIAIVLLDRAPTPAGVFAAVLAVGLAGTCAFIPVGGRAVAEWAPVAGLHLVRRTTRRRRFASGVAAAGTRIALPLRRGVTAGHPRPVPPPQLRGVRILSAGHHGRSVGALAEDSARRLTAVLACRVLAFALLDPDAQERRLARWGQVLSAAGSGAIRRLQWIERTAPAPGDELAHWLHAERDPAVARRGTPMIESYLELIGSTDGASQVHEVLIAVQIDTRRQREHRRSDPMATLIEATDRVARGLRAAEVTVLGALGPEQLAETLRTAFDPYARPELARLRAADPGRLGLAAHAAWPLAARETWDHYAADGARHATYWVRSWPRLEVSPLFLSPLLSNSGTVRTVAVAFEPLTSARSTRDVEAAMTRDRADRELRARFGQSETARQRQAREATARREAELAAGHGEVRLSGFVTVTGRDEEDLRLACAEVLDQSARAHLELHRLYGQQAQAFTFTLPLGRGLR